VALVDEKPTCYFRSQLMKTCSTDTTSNKPEKLHLTGYSHQGFPYQKEVEQEETRTGMVGNTAKPSRSLLYFPLKLGPKTIGCLSVQSYQYNAYTSDDVTLLENITNQISAAIRNAQLFETTQINEANFRNLAFLRKFTSSSELRAALSHRRITGVKSRRRNRQVQTGYRAVRRCRFMTDTSGTIYVNPAFTVYGFSGRSPRQQPIFQSGLISRKITNTFGIPCFPRAPSPVSW
jgi:ribosomal protein S18